ncbi:MAG: hypothetical protein ABWY25_10885, partial [Paenisporosarcina sp.]
EVGVVHAGNTTALAQSATVLKDSYMHFDGVSEGATEPLPQGSYEPTLPYFKKSTDAILTTLSYLALEVQFCGCYGLEDGEASTELVGTPDAIGWRNAPYYTSLLARKVAPGINSVACASGTYVGNGTGQDILIELPGIHFLYIRNTSTHVKTWWWTTMLGPHMGAVDDDIRPGLLISATMPETGGTVISLLGASANGNANGVTYQYFAFSDVASRILLNTVWRHSNNDMVNTLFDPNFLPEFIINQVEGVKNNSGIVNVYIKGPGFTAANAKRINSTPVATGMTINTGSVTTGSTLTISTQTQAAACWRSWDGGDIVPNIIYIGQYTGDGTATRSISIPLNGRRPIFAIVTPVTTIAATYVRDASNSGAMSTLYEGATTSLLAIKGGDIDTIIVGSALNANGVVHSLMVFPSCSTDAGNDGWGVDDVCGIADPGWNGPGQPDSPDWYGVIPDIPADVAMVGSGGIVLSGETSKLIVEDLSGIYTIVPGKTNDTLLDRQIGQEEVVVKIPDPSAKTGYIGG